MMIVSISDAECSSVELGIWESDIMVCIDSMAVSSKFLNIIFDSSAVWAVSWFYKK